MSQTTERLRLFSIRADADENLVIDFGVVDRPLACQLLSIGRTKLGQLCASGQLDRRHIGRKAVITVASIRQYLAQLPN